MREIRLSGSEGGVADNGHLYPYRGGGSGPGPLAEMRARRTAGLVGMVSHRPFPGLPGEAGMARETRALPGGGRPGWAAGGDSGQQARWCGRDGVSPSVPWAAG